MIRYLAKEFRDIEELNLEPAREIARKKEVFERYLRATSLLRKVVKGEDSLTNYMQTLRELKSKSFVPHTVDPQLREKLPDLERLLGPLFTEDHETSINNALSYGVAEMAFVPLAVIVHDTNRRAIDRRTFLRAGEGALVGFAAGSIAGSLASGLKYLAYGSREYWAGHIQMFAIQHYRKA
ncbi:hypothetical protein HYX07_00485 [Candidatus Woesearchaeota archaeon]|nr:hypothetical protein [Candidatus Woesearchaeota archaeon]